MSRRGGRRGRWGRQEAGSAPQPPPTVEITDPTDAASIDWGATTTITARVTDFGGSDDNIASVTWRLGSGSETAMTEGVGVFWYNDHVWTLAEVGASQTLTITATDTNGRTGTASITITIVDPFVALSVTHWRLDANTTIADASSNAISSWSLAGVTRSDMGGGVYRIIEDTSTGTHIATSTETNGNAGPGTFAVRFGKASTRDLRLTTTGKGATIAAATGATSGVDAGLTVTVTDGGTYWIVVAHDASWDTTPWRTYHSNAGSLSYTGNGTAFLELSELSAGELATFGGTGLFTQRRASDVNERVGTYGNLLQATAAFQPFLWDGSSWTQTSGLYFNGSEFMIAGSGNSSQPDTVGVVWNATSAAGTYGVYSGGTTTAGALTTASTLISIRAGSTVSTGQAPTTATQIDVTRYEGATSWNRHNGTQTADLNPGTTVRGGGLMIGLLYTGAYLTGMIKDVFYKSGGLNATEAARCEKALAQLRSVTLA